MARAAVDARANQPTDRELRALLRASDLLDPPLKRQWLRVLPYLSVDDRRRLHAILSGEGETSGQTQTEVDLEALER